MRAWASSLLLYQAMSAAFMPLKKPGEANRVGGDPSKAKNKTSRRGISVRAVKRILSAECCALRSIWDLRGKRVANAALT